MDVAFFVLHPQIAGTKVPVQVERIGCLAWLSVIPPHDPRTPDHDLPHTLHRRIVQARPPSNLEVTGTESEAFTL